MIDPKYMSRYHRAGNLRTKSGRAAVDNGDLVSIALRGMTVDDLKKVVDANGMSERWETWGKMHPGRCRMAVGNSLRWKLHHEGSIELPKRED